MLLGFPLPVCADIVLGAHWFSDAPFVRSIDHLDRIVHRVAGFSVLSGFRHERSVCRWAGDRCFSDIAAVVISIALAERCIARGVLVAGTVGMGAGEFAAAHIAGALSLEETIKAVHDLCEDGDDARSSRRSVVLASGIRSARALCLMAGGEACVAMHLGIGETVLTGTPGGIRAVKRLCDALDMRIRDVSIHGSLLGSACQPTHELQSVSSTPAETPVPSIYSAAVVRKLTREDLRPGHAQRILRNTGLWLQVILSAERDLQAPVLQFSPSTCLSHHSDVTFTPDFFARPRIAPPVFGARDTPEHAAAFPEALFSKAFTADRTRAEVGSLFIRRELRVGVTSVVTARAMCDESHSNGSGE